MPSLNEDAYEACRYVQHYSRKNGYSPGRDELGVSKEFVDALARNDVIEIIPLYPSGVAVKVILTVKGRRMAEDRSSKRTRNYL